MNAKKLFLTLTLVALGLAGLQAGEGREVASAKRQLHNEIRSLFDNVPFGDVIDNENSSTIRIKFIVSKSQQIENIVVEGENADLVHYAKMVLRENTIKPESLLAGKTIGVSMRFVYKT